MSTDHLTPKRDFSSLSVQDLLQARDAYHVHLAHLANVVGTAVGRFRVRIEDADDPARERSRKSWPPKTLSNSVIKPWSWPCVLVFVDRWLPLNEFRKNPDQAVPRFLYMPDGRVIPTCVVVVEKSE